VQYRAGKIVCIVFLSLWASLSAAQTLDERVAALLNSLNPKQRQTATFQFDSQERFNWHYVPRARKGVTLYELNDEQRRMLMTVLDLSLSTQGATKAKGILELEDLLREAEGRPSGDDYRDRLNYAFSVFGTPAKTTPWGWRLEGHHLSLNFTSVGGVIESSTPSFFGANPAIVRSGKERGRQTLKQETELAFALLNQLSDEQRKIAVLSTSAPYDIITGNDRKVEAPERKGILYSSLTDAQKKTFMQLIDAYVKNYELGFSSKLIAKIRKAGVENLSFAWAGSLQPGAAHYYRIQGPILLIEYDNTQNSGNHIHSVVRDLTNDFAEDILREHYRKDHTP